MQNPKVSNTQERNITRCSEGCEIVSHFSRKDWWTAKLDILWTMIANIWPTGLQRRIDRREPDFSEEYLASIFGM
jgi:hypothetical protein